MIPFPNKKYKTIVIDPPWPVATGFVQSSGYNVSDNCPYSLMTKEEILAIPINNLADDNCDLFLWTTQTVLLFSFEVLKNWGFKFSCLMTWDKVKALNAYGFFRNSEFILYAHKGKTNRDFSKKNIPTCFREPLRRHSEKPKIFYDLIRRVTREPRIDIFARKKIEGFDSYGNDQELEAETLEAFL